MAKLIALVGLVFFALVSVAQSLRSKDVEEGPCLSIPATKEINSTWFDQAVFSYVPGGNKYSQYRKAALYPKFPELREFEFYYDFCLRVEANFKSGFGLTFGFGNELLGNYTVIPVPGQEGVLDFVRVLPSGLKEVSRHTPILTDNSTYVLYSVCWMDTYQRGWGILGTTHALDENNQRLVEQYLKILKYDRKQFVFTRRDGCSCDSQAVSKVTQN